jgi:hypothetical protein
VTNLPFWHLVNKAGPDECWLWTGRVRPRDGYGASSLPGAKPRRYMGPHRVAYILTYGEPAPGLQVDHICNVKLCCNPAHLQAVTQYENLMRSSGITARLKAQTHCVRGHAFDAANTAWQVRRNGRAARACLACRRLRYRRGKLAGM